MKHEKNYKIWYLISLVIGIPLLISGCAAKFEIEEKAWFTYASKFDEASKVLLTNDALGKKTAFQDMGNMYRIKQKFLKADQPTEEEIIFILKSQDRRLQKVGLVAMSLKPVETDQLADILFEFLQDQDRDFRLYAVHSLREFTNFSKSKSETRGMQLLKLIKNEKDLQQSVSEMLLLAKFPSKKTALFLTEQSMKEGKENYLIRNFAFDALKRMGDSYFAEGKEYINKNGSPEIKEEFFEREKTWFDIESEQEKSAEDEAEQQFFEGKSPFKK